MLALKIFLFSNQINTSFDIIAIISGQTYFGKKEDLWPGLATYRLLFIALGEIPFCNASLKYRNCTGPIGRLPAVKVSWKTGIEDRGSGIEDRE